LEPTGAAARLDFAASWLAATEKLVTPAETGAAGGP